VYQISEEILIVDIPINMNGAVKITKIKIKSTFGAILSKTMRTKTGIAVIKITCSNIFTKYGEPAIQFSKVRTIG
jgi:hypothetical protein